MARRQFRREQRLTQAEDFKRVFERAQRAGNRWMTILAVPNDLDGPRLGMAIAKRKIRLAHQRNCLKRIVRESFRHHQNTIGPIDCVVLAGPAASSATPAQLRRAVDELWPRIVKRCAV